MTRRPAWIAIALACASTGCAQTPIPPFGEALFIVDTDLPVPTLASSLRLDVYAEDGSAWYDHREIPLPLPIDWPASFSLFDPVDDGARDALVRLRVYPRGKERDYRGERDGPRPSSDPPSADATVPEPPGDLGPRLLDGDDDVTPPSEPQPMLAVDKLLRLHLDPGERGAVRVTMRGTCIGTMADSAGQSSCVDAPGIVAPAEDAVLDPDMSVPTTSVAGTFGGREPCTLELRTPGSAADGTPLFDDEACAPGGAFIFGNPAPSLYDTVPERAAILAPFRMDKFEVTVGRYRDARMHGLRASADGTPYANPKTLNPYAGDKTICTFSDELLGRETFPLNCISPQAAREFCAFAGQRAGGTGLLPSETQWEYVAQAVGRVTKTTFPWGNATPTCDRAVYAVDPNGDVDTDAKCVETSGAGPKPVDAALHADGDVSIGLGVVGLGGSMSELLRDPYARMAANCWVSAPPIAPACVGVMGTPAVRGGAWFDAPDVVIAALRYTAGDPSRNIGFRCVRE